MILKKVGNTKLFCSTKKAPDGKWLKATPTAIADANSNFKIGDSIIAEFNEETWVIEKISHSKPGKTGGGGSGSGSGGGYENMVERSVLASVAMVVASMNLTKIMDVKIALTELFGLGYDLVKGNTSKIDTPKVEEVEENPEPED